MLRERRLLVGVAALGLAATGCPPPPPKSAFPTADDALARMHACYDCAVGLQGTAKVDVFTKKGRVKGEVFLFAINPESVRFDVVSPFGAGIYTLTSDGKDFKLADQEQKTFFYGPANACNLARFTQVNVPPHALVSLLRGEAPVLAHTPEQAEISWEGGDYKIILRSKNEAVEEIHLEVRPEDLDKPWSEQRVRVTSVRVEQGGQNLYTAELKDYKVTTTAPPRPGDEDLGEDPTPPSGPACDAEYPSEIRFRVPKTKDDVVFEYKEAKWNPPLIEGTFTQPVPGGMTQAFVTCE